MPDTLQQQFLSALDRGNLERIREVILAGADVNRPIGNPGGETPLIRAITTAQMELVSLLIENGADVNLPWKWPTLWTPLMFAYDNPAIIAQLLASGADVHARAAAPSMGGIASAPQSGSGGETALHLAAAANNAEAVKLLVQAGADVEAKAENGFGPLDCALALGAPTAAAVALVEGGAQLTSDRLEKMHTAAHDPDSNLVYFPCISEATASQRKKEADSARDHIVPRNDYRQSELRCPFCHSLLYSRVPKLCGRCGKLLPLEILNAAQEAHEFQEQRKWAWELANSFDQKHSERCYNHNDVSNPSPSPKQLLRQDSCAAEFKHRKRPGFMLHVLAYYLVFLLPAFTVVRLKIIDAQKTLSVAIVLIAFFCYRAWQRASPICPNCKQDITHCTANYCHICGESLQNRRCEICDVDASWSSFLRPWGNAGNLRRVIFCPGCGVLLESKIPRSRPLFRKAL